MKKYLLLQLMLFCLLNAFAQQRYYVSVVKGIVLDAAGKKVIVGSKVGLDDKIVFKTKTAMLILLNPVTGRIIVSPSHAEPAKDLSFSGQVKDFLEINQSAVRLSAGMGKPENIQRKNYPASTSPAGSEDSLRIKHN